MKKEKYPIVIFTDEDYIGQMTKEIEVAKTEFQKLLDMYNSFDLKTILTYKELFRLIYDPEGVCGSLNGVPPELYIQANKCRSVSDHEGRLDLWLIEDGARVVTNDGELQRFLHANDIEVMNKEQQQFAEDVVDYVRLSNGLSKFLMEFPGRMPSEPWSQTGKYFSFIHCLKLENQALQVLLNQL
jgi:hypothetical protein